MPCVLQNSLATCVGEQQVANCFCATTSWPRRTAVDKLERYFIFKFEFEDFLILYLITFLIEVKGRNNFILSTYYIFEVIYLFILKIKYIFETRVLKEHAYSFA